MTMNIKNGFSIIISSCDKFSDLWDSNIFLLRKHWNDTQTKIFLVTDLPTEKSYDGVTIVSAGEGTEITERLQCVLELISTPYVLFTLDDYFLTENIDYNRIGRVVKFMDSEAVDYVRLYKASKYFLCKERARQSKRFSGFYLRDISEGEYKISLYPGMWRADFMRKTVGEKLNVWQYEVALTEMARKYGARCAISNNNEFPFLDVIRKGKLLRKANRFFIKNNINSEREIMCARDEFKLKFRTFLRHALPRNLFLKLKSFMKSHGHEFYS